MGIPKLLGHRRYKPFKVMTSRRAYKNNSHSPFFQLFPKKKWKGGGIGQCSACTLWNIKSTKKVLIKRSNTVLHYIGNTRPKITDLYFQMSDTNY